MLYTDAASDGWTLEHESWFGRMSTRPAAAAQVIKANDDAGVGLPMEYRTAPADADTVTLIFYSPDTDTATELVSGKRHAKPLYA